MNTRKWMSTAVVFVLTALLTVPALTVPALAGPWRGWRGSGGWGMGGGYQLLYNPATVETVGGEVVSIDKVTPMKGMSYGIHIVVKSDKETVPVHLGPAWYV